MCITISDSYGGMGGYIRESSSEKGRVFGWEIEKKWGPPAGFERFFAKK